MKKLSLLLLIFTSVLFVGCSDDDPVPAPVAAFSVEKTLKTVTFTNSSTGADTYLWDFGDGKTSTELSPVHVYDNFGSFDAKLTATNEGGSDSRTIKVDLISAFQKKWTVVSAIQTATSDFTAGGGQKIVSPSPLDNAQANTVLSYVLAELSSTNTSPLTLSLDQGGAVKLNDVATTKSTWTEVGGELNIVSSVNVVANNSKTVVGTLGNDGKLTLTFGDLGKLSTWPASFHIADQPGQPGSGTYITSVTNVDKLVVVLENK